MPDFVSNCVAAFAKTISSTINWRRRTKRIVLASADGIVLTIVLWLLFAFRYGDFSLPAELNTLLLILLGPILIVSALLFRNAYHEVTRFIGLRGGIKLITAVLFAGLVWATIVLMLGQQGVPRTVIASFVLLAPVCIMLLRNIAAALLRWSGVYVPDRWQTPERIPVAIYGAGRLGAELGFAFAGNKTRRLVAFFDNSPGVIGRTIDGIRVFDPARMPDILGQLGIREVIIAQKGIAQPAERLRLLKVLEEHNVRLRILPELDAFASGRISVSQMRPVEGRELLGRATIPPDVQLLKQSVSNKVVLVTGAGGSIGSELVRQCFALEPKMMILVENSEFALYKVEKELLKLNSRRKADSRIQIRLHLTSVLNHAAMSDIFNTHSIDTVFHSAAFKHVPMVETNLVSGVMNNTLGTQTLAAIASEAGVERFVFISTDKAVRPKSVLGASKRVAELIVQAHASRSQRTKFCSVRFGNVLGSSGSVFELFIEQIQSGGPVTVTHPDVVRYFMSLEEAATLVIQAASMAEEGEIYLLNMGEPVRVVDMARSLILLLGFTEKSVFNPEGEIEILFTGLRPGEKITEELLIEPELAIATEHSQIKRSKEPSPNVDRIWEELANIERAVAQRDAALVVASLTALVSNYEVSKDVLGTVQTPEPRVVN